VLRRPWWWWRRICLGYLHWCCSKGTRDHQSSGFRQTKGGAERKEKPTASGSGREGPAPRNQNRITLTLPRSGREHGMKRKLAKVRKRVIEKTFLGARERSLRCPSACKQQLKQVLSAPNIAVGNQQLRAEKSKKTSLKHNCKLVPRTRVSRRPAPFPANNICASERAVNGKARGRTCSRPQIASEAGVTHLPIRSFA